MVIMAKVRLQKYLADCGVASRRKAEELIRAGKVVVNGKLVQSSELGVKIDPDRDRVLVNRVIVKPTAKKIYLKLYKPRGYISSCVSERGERTIMDLVKDVPERLFPIGRLDQASEGLMILTNDGELANRLMHPRYEHEKEYEVAVEDRLMKDDLNKLSSGMVIDGEETLPAKVKQLTDRSFSIVLKEGKKRQIRRMVEELGGRVKILKRVRIGKVKLGSLRPGEFKIINFSEISPA